MSGSYENQGSGYDPGAAGHELQGRSQGAPLRPKVPEKDLYYVQGRCVMARSVETDNGDGTSSMTMGFKVCTAAEFVDGAAEEIAAALNKTRLGGDNVIMSLDDHAALTAKAEELDKIEALQTALRRLYAATHRLERPEGCALDEAVKHALATLEASGLTIEHDRG